MDKVRFYLLTFEYVEIMEYDILFFRIVVPSGIHVLHAKFGKDNNKFLNNQMDSPTKNSQ